MLIFDTLEYSEKMQAVGFTPAQAKVQAETLKQLIDNDLATKKDLKELEIILKHDVKELEIILKHDVKELEIILRKEIAEVKAELIKWMFGIAGGQVALIIALLKLL